MLHGNYSVFTKSPLTYRAGTSQSGERSNWGTNGQKRNVQMQDRQTTANELYALPQGGYVGLAWMLPQQSGNLASINAAGMSLTPTGAVVGGVTSNASANFAITVADATGGLITSGTGTASLSVTMAPSLLTASLSAVGSASLLFDASALLGAKASAQGSASFAVTGSFTPYAIGQMIGTTVDATALTAASIAGAVWTTEAAQYLGVGTFGAKLNSAAAGGVDYGAMSSSVRSELSAELLRIVELAKIHGLVQGVDLVVSESARTAGSISQSISSVGAATVVSRQ